MTARDRLPRRTRLAIRPPGPAVLLVCGAVGDRRRDRRIARSCGQTRTHRRSDHGWRSRRRAAGSETRSLLRTGTSPATARARTPPWTSAGTATRSRTSSRGPGRVQAPRTRSRRPRPTTALGPHIVSAVACFVDSTGGTQCDGFTADQMTYVVDPTPPTLKLTPASGLADVAVPGDLRTGDPGCGAYTGVQF